MVRFSILRRLIWPSKLGHYRGPQPCNPHALYSFGEARPPAAIPVPAADRPRPVRFASLGENLVAIYRACVENKVDPRLARVSPDFLCAPSGLNEVDPSAGGFLVETAYAQQLVASLYEEAPLAALCDRRPTDFPLADIRLPGVDETSRADGSRWGGVLSYWLAEADQVPGTMPRWRSVRVSANKLIALATGPAELMQDAPLFDVHIRGVFSADMGFKLDLTLLSCPGSPVPAKAFRSAL
jgi:HK97 family phage major capsid protein